MNESDAKYHFISIFPSILDPIFGSTSFDGWITPSLSITFFVSLEIKAQFIQVFGLMNQFFEWKWWQIPFHFNFSIHFWPNFPPNISKCQKLFGNKGPIYPSFWIDESVFWMKVMTNTISFQFFRLFCKFLGQIKVSRKTKKWMKVTPNTISFQFFHRFSRPKKKFLFWADFGRF